MSLYDLPSDHASGMETEARDRVFDVCLSKMQGWLGVPATTATITTNNSNITTTTAMQATSLLISATCTNLTRLASALYESAQPFDLDRIAPPELARPLYGVLSPAIIIVSLVCNGVLVALLLCCRKGRFRGGGCTRGGTCCLGWCCGQCRRPTPSPPPSSVLLAGMAALDALTGGFQLPFMVYAYLGGGLVGDGGGDTAYPTMAWCRVYWYLSRILPSLTHTASIWLAALLALQRYLAVTTTTTTTTATVRTSTTTVASRTKPHLRPFPFPVRIHNQQNDGVDSNVNDDDNQATSTNSLEDKYSHTNPQNHMGHFKHNGMRNADLSSSSKCFDRNDAQNDVNQVENIAISSIFPENENKHITNMQNCHYSDNVFKNVDTTCSSKPFGRNCVKSGIDKDSSSLWIHEGKNHHQLPTHNRNNQNLSHDGMKSAVADCSSIVPKNDHFHEHHNNDFDEDEESPVLSSSPATGTNFRPCPQNDDKNQSGVKNDRLVRYFIISHQNDTYDHNNANIKNSSHITINNDNGGDVNDSVITSTWRPATHNQNRSNNHTTTDNSSNINKDDDDDVEDAARCSGQQPSIYNNNNNINNKNNISKDDDEVYEDPASYLSQQHRKDNHNDMNKVNNNTNNNTNKGEEENPTSSCQQTSTHSHRYYGHKIDNNPPTSSSQQPFTHNVNNNNNNTDNDNDDAEEKGDAPSCSSQQSSNHNHRNNRHSNSDNNPSTSLSQQPSTHKNYDTDTNDDDAEEKDDAPPSCRGCCRRGMTWALCSARGAAAVGVVFTGVAAVLHCLQAAFFTLQPVTVISPHVLTPAASLDLQETCSLRLRDRATSDVYNYGYTWLRLVLAEFVPCGLIAVFNVKLVRLARRSSRYRRSLVQGHRQSEKQESRSARRTTVMLVTVTTTALLTEVVVVIIILIEFLHVATSRSLIDQRLVNNLGVVSNFLITMMLPANFLIYTYMNGHVAALLRGLARALQFCRHWLRGRGDEDLSRGSGPRTPGDEGATAAQD